jgi:carbon monoxide dehydrogenase subunit G
MTRLTETLEVDGSVADVFAFIGDFANVPAWDPGTVESTKITSGDIGVGTRYHVVAEFNGRRLPLEYVVREWQPPRRVVLEGEGKTFRGVDEISFDPTPSGGTRITYVADLKLRGVLRVAEPFMRSRFEQTAKDGIAGMRRALEERTRGTRTEP